ncbi:glyoxylase-like metal-dependent hydrolase (beta-lactamase superfamily II) [Naumannella cuiyingiana]|uniref:Glyoxylase-like metal-dependent hydrolase (Beta-lactamase superfamily II) n=1 Tax=Naumannella cuiyingiana TaxID=1347891 RepID=A0A7Z0DAY8_9ACTN|nr:MBL fold metallo-hydrolase [Naumannella cuiyingiana]NYI71985.1 glyoxylase-like metal-dependent hydrolase (beta-lactamase superfamily II) [Naumannella cuiyingiana]
MKITSFNAGTLRVPGAEPFVSHCLLIADGDARVLIDTGLGHNDIAHRAELLASFHPAVAPALDPAEAIVDQLGRAGVPADAVTDVIITHADVDHVGGLADLPRARVHVTPALLAAITEPADPATAGRLFAHQWRHEVSWAAPAREVTSPLPGLIAHRPDLPGALRDRILLIDLPGHAPGHVGVLIELDPGAGPRWLLHAGDAYHARGQLTGGELVPLVGRLINEFAHDPELTRRTVGRLAELDGRDDVLIISAHDPADLRAARDLAG